ncbi:MAG: restriction endonuclease [Nitrospirota bacterium]
MPIPDYQSLMLPLLKLAGDKKEHSFNDAVDTFATQFKLTEEERKTLLPSGRYPTFDSRVGWAKTYLTKAKLLEITRKGYFQITDRGIDALKKKPVKIDVQFLKQYKEFLEFQNITKINEPGKKVNEKSAQQTPEEILESAFIGIKNKLAQDLLEKIKICSPKYFEQIVLDLLIALGYGGTKKDAAQVVGKSGDEGIDGIIKEDKLGLDIIYVQAKRWNGNTKISRETIQSFVGSLEGKHANKGIFITTAEFAPTARDYVSKIQKKIILIDGNELSQLMIDYNVGVSKVTLYEIKQIDSDYFIEE